MTGVDRYTDALADLRLYNRPRNVGGSDPETLAEAQVNATLAVAAATALQAILPLVGGDSDEVTQWAKLLLPGYSGGRRYTQGEWFEVLAEDAPALPLKVGHVEVNTDEAADGTPVLDVGAGRHGARLTAVQAERLGLALLKWSHGVPAAGSNGGGAAAPVVPEYWPPQPGDIWADRNDNNWACLADGTLACAAFTADDTAEEVRRAYGEMRLWYRGCATVEKVPF